MNPIIRCLSASLLASTVAACVGGASKRLPVSHDLGPVNGHRVAAVKVTVDAPVGLWDERIRYRLLYDDATAIRYYNLDRWEAPPPELIERYLTLSGNRRVTVRIRLDRLEQQFERPGKSLVIMAMTVEARSVPDDRLLGVKTIALSQTAERADAAGAIAGFAELTERARNEIQRWLKAL